MLKNGWCVEENSMHALLHSSARVVPETLLFSNMRMILLSGVKVSITLAKRAYSEILMLVLLDKILCLGLEGHS